MLTFTGAVRLWHVFLLAFLLGCVTVADNPTRQAFVTDMVGGDQVANAVGLNSAVFNAARLVGPAVAVVLIKTVGIASAFFINAASYVAVIAGLLAMDPASLFRAPRAARSRGQVREGLRYVRRSPVLLSTILLMTVVATFGLNFKVFLPLLALAMHGGAGIYGLFTSLLAGGALVGGLAAAAAPGVGLASLLLIPVGATSIAFIATANTTLQLNSSPAMRGRVMALYAFVFLGSTPLGGPLMGWISQHWGPRDAMALGGLLSLAASLAAWAQLARARRDVLGAEVPAMGGSSAPRTQLAG